MADTYKVKVNHQKVFHDGTSMIVLKPKGKNPEVPEQFIKMLVDEGAIDPPKGWEAPEVVDDGGVPAVTADGGAPLIGSEPASDEEDDEDAGEGEDDDAEKGEGAGEGAGADDKAP